MLFEINVVYEYNLIVWSLSFWRVFLIWNGRVIVVVSS